MKLLKPTEVAELLQIPLKAVYRLIRERRLAAIRVGRRVRVSSLDLDAYLVEGRRAQERAQ